MIDPELRAFIQHEIKKSLNVILNGVTEENSAHSETISNMFPGMPKIENRPLVQPFGVSSRAPQGTLNVIARQGEHFGNRIVIGHRDSNKPQVDDQGEAMLYNSEGQLIYVKKGQVRIGKKEAQNPVPVGNELKAFLQELMNLLANHTHITSAPGSQTSNPFQEVSGTQFTKLKTDNIDNDKILSQYVFVDKTFGG